MTTGEVLHIHCHAEPDQRQHTLTGGCWCHPYTLRLTNGDTVIDHNGAVRPSVVAVAGKVNLGMDNQRLGLHARTGRSTYIPIHQRKRPR